MAANIAGQAQPGLLRLPAEIMEAVARALPEEDLPTLRLICREIESKTLRIYTNAFFTDKSFLLSSEMSMKYLNDISGDPYFGKAMERVRFVLQCIQYSQLDSAWSSLAKKMKAGAAELSKDQKATYFDLRRNYFDMSDKSVLAFAGHNPLRDGIAKLKYHSLALEIRSSAANASHRPRQVKIMEQALDHTIQLIPMFYSSRLTATILRYFIENECALSELRLLDPTNLETLGIFALFDTSISNLRLQSSTSAIHTPEISVAISIRSTSEGVRGAKSLFAALPDLRDLKLQADYNTGGLGESYEWNSTGFARALTTSFMPKLQSADFDMIFPNLDELKRYVQRHMQTFQELHLKGDWITNGGANGLESELQEFSVKAGV